jgi:hypothetical protein
MTARRRFRLFIRRTTIRSRDKDFLQQFTMGRLVELDRNQTPFVFGPDFLIGQGAQGSVASGTIR